MNVVDNFKHLGFTFSSKISIFYLEQVLANWIDSRPQNQSFRGVKYGSVLIIHAKSWNNFCEYISFKVSGSQFAALKMNSLSSIFTDFWSKAYLYFQAMR